jgi:DNA repair protein RecO (recombination protein O)
MLVRDEAIVLRRFEFGETSLVLHLLARSHGRVSVLAKGAYRPRSPFLGVLDLLNRIETVVSFSPRREIQILVEADLRDSHPGLRADLRRLHAALYLSELVQEGAREGEPHRDLHDLFSEALARLSEKTGDVEPLVLAFELRYLRILGLRPALGACATCAAPLPSGPAIPFSYGSGGALCAGCSRDARGAIQVAPGTLRVASRLSEIRLDEADRIRLHPRLAASLRTLLDGFIAYHFERPPRSRRHLRWGRAHAR